MLMNRKKGMTLAEIVVVLAVIAIVSTIVVSFSLMVNRKSQISRNKVEVVGEINLVEKLVDSWVYQQILSSNELVIEASRITSSNDDELSLIDNKILGYEVTNIESITFEKYEKNNDMLIICTINYYLLNSAGNKDINSYVFCINEYIGDIIYTGVDYE